jgi:putative membrane protein
MKSNVRQWAAAVAVAGLGCVVGCGTGDRVRDVYNQERAERRVEAGKLEAGEVYSAAKAIHQGELDMIAAVQGRIDDSTLRAYAERVAADHRAGLEKLEAASKKVEGFAPVERDLTNDLKDEARHDAEELADIRGDALDEEFAEKMVESHERALNLIDSQLLPSATGELVQCISELRTHVTQHLQEAKQLEESISK